MWLQTRTQNVVSADSDTPSADSDALSADEERIALYLALLFMSISQFEYLGGGWLRLRLVDLIRARYLALKRRWALVSVWYLRIVVSECY